MARPGGKNRERALGTHSKRQLPQARKARIVYVFAYVTIKRLLLYINRAVDLQNLIEQHESLLLYLIAIISQPLSCCPLCCLLAVKNIALLELRGVRCPGPATMRTTFLASVRAQLGGGLCGLRLM